MSESQSKQLDHLLVIEDKQGKRIITLEAATCSIGRDSSNSIVLYSHLVSRQHAILLRVTMPGCDRHLFRIVDGNLQGKRSTNGLIINGERCFAHDLKHGDEIAFSSDVQAKYYVASDLDAPTESPNAQTIIGVDREDASEAMLVRLASFPELNSNPIIEIDLAGNITYLNPAALAQFPDIRENPCPLLVGVLESVKREGARFSIREVEIDTTVYEQSIHYIAESDLIRSYFVDITQRKQTEIALRESEARNRALLSAVPDLMLRINSDGTYLDYIPAKIDNQQPTDSHLLGKNEYEVLPKEVASQRMHYVEKALATGEAQIFEYQLPVDGSLRSQEARIVASGEDEVLAIVRDISDRKLVEAEIKQARDELEQKVRERTAELIKANELLRNEIATRQRVEEEVRFLQTMTQAITESANFHSALEVTLQQVCDFTGWKFGEAWIPNSDRTMLECSPAWYGASPNLEKFRQLSHSYTFAPGAGLPGRVWLSKNPEWIQDVSCEPETFFLRKGLAIDVGFKGGLGIPIIDGDRVLAVLVFFMFEASSENKRLVEIVVTAATQLGSLIQRKRAEEALKDSEERFRLLVEGGKDFATFMLDPNGYIVSWNSGAERIKGYETSEIIGKHFSCFYIKEDNYINVPAQILQVAKVDGQIETEGWRIGKDGARIWVNEIVTALRDRNGKLRGFSLVVRDITERRQSQEALRESEQRLQAILDNSTALIYVKDLQGRYLMINAWAGILLNIDREYIKGKTDYELFPKEIADSYRTNDLKVLEARSPLDWEETVLQSDGSHTYVAIKFPLFDAAGEPYAVCGISTDISDRKRAEDALRSSVATNRALLNAIPDCMFRINHEGVFVNSKAAKDNYLPLPTAEFLGKNLSDVFPQDVAMPLMDCVQLALATGNVQIFEYQLLLNGNLLDFEARIAVSAENEVMAIIRDITERKRVETDIRTALEKEKELSELKSRFVTMASHEFRTPLATILSSTELLEYYSHKWSEEKKATHLQRIQSSVKHMTHLLDDVLLIGKAEAGKLDFKPMLLNVEEFCRDLVEEVQLTTSSHTINFQLSAQCTNVCMDEKLLRHILSNLLTNAIKYSPQGGDICFDFDCNYTNAIFRIQDDGIGIPTTDLDNLFNSFHRASNVGTISGTGLGLAIVKKSVDLHGGTIAVQSELGFGTAFTVSIPISSSTNSAIN
ncbi:PAS domain S-box protein [Aliterella atlantica]|uniref:PAS domain S-box protein n=1 Tax=Aliterella atlantica TaxID=1827278 RepID=UPI000695FF4C|nr:PAS domain S-box protein [Aliterella atlantica]